MPDLKDLIGVVVAAYLALAMAGRLDLFYRALGYMEGQAHEAITADWGCPSVFSVNACGAPRRRRH
jgi:hypothetical protein